MKDLNTLGRKQYQLKERVSFVRRHLKEESVKSQPDEQIEFYRRADTYY